MGNTETTAIFCDGSVGPATHEWVLPTHRPIMGLRGSGGTATSEMVKLWLGPDTNDPGAVSDWWRRASFDAARQWLLLDIGAF